MMTPSLTPDRLGKQERILAFDFHDADAEVRKACYKRSETCFARFVEKPDRNCRLIEKMHRVIVPIIRPNSEAPVLLPGKGERIPTLINQRECTNDELIDLNDAIMADLAEIEKTDKTKAIELVNRELNARRPEHLIQICTWKDALPFIGTPVAYTATSTSYFMQNTYRINNFAFGLLSPCTSPRVNGKGLAIDQFLVADSQPIMLMLMDKELQNPDIVFYLRTCQPSELQLLKKALNTNQAKLTYIERNKAIEEISKEERRTSRL